MPSVAGPTRHTAPEVSGRFVLTLERSEVAPLARVAGDVLGTGRRCGRSVAEGPRALSRDGVNHLFLALHGRNS